MVRQVLTADRLLQVIRERCSGMDRELAVFWYQVTEDRDRYRDSVLTHRGGFPVAPIVVREVGFQNPNMIASDLVDIVSKHRELFSATAFLDADTKHPVVVLLLGRTELGVAQVSSPVTLPDWFPRVGGRQYPVIIEDLTLSADDALNAKELRLDELSEFLYELEGALIRRLSAVSNHDKCAADGLLLDMLGPDSAPANEFFAEADSRWKAVRNKSAYRPASSDKASLLGSLVRMVCGSSPDGLYKKAKHLCRALGMTGESTKRSRECIAAVLFGASQRNEPPEVRFGRNTLILIYVSWRLLTASAHADDYPRYSLAMLRGLSHDLRSALIAVAYELKSMDGVG